MSNEQEKIEDAMAIASGTAVALTPWQQGWKGLKIAFATKKAAMAAYALFFGVTAATGAMTANYISDGMTADQLQTQQTLEQTMEALAEQAKAYAELTEDLENELLDLQEYVILLDTVHEQSVDTGEHVVGYHEHPDYALVEHAHPGAEPVFVEHEHEQYMTHEEHEAFEHTRVEIIAMPSPPSPPVTGVPKHKHRYEDVLN